MTLADAQKSHVDDLGDCVSFAGVTHSTDADVNVVATISMSDSNIPATAEPLGA